MYICTSKLVAIMMHRTDNLSKSTRVAILSTAFFVSLLLLLQALWVCNYYINAEAHARYVGVTNVASEKIAKTISGMEMNAMNVFDEVQSTWIRLRRWLTP